MLTSIRDFLTHHESDAKTTVWLGQKSILKLMAKTKMI